MPHCVARLYNDSGPLIGAIKEREAEVRDIMTSVPGFISYAIIDTGQGAISLTTCQDKAGCDESIQRAADWIKTNLPDAKIDPPRILEGEPMFRFTAEQVSDNRPHVVARIFSDPPPPGLKEREGEVRELMTAVPGFRAYNAIDLGNGGITLVVGEDKAATDEIGRRMREYVQATAPGVLRATPQIIEGEGVFRFEARAAPA
jgi:hypothetical protein